MYIDILFTIGCKIIVWLKEFLDIFLFILLLCLIINRVSQLFNKKPLFIKFRYIAT